MSLVTRLRLLTGLLGVSAATIVIGTTVFGDIRNGDKPAAVKPDAAVAAAAELARTKFTDQPALTYRTPAGQTVFAWQVKPALSNISPRDKDIVVLVDTSASQAGKPLAAARQIIAGLSKVAGPNDRIDVWTVNLDNEKATRSLTRGFKPASDDMVRAAAGRLTEIEFASGATDLKAGIEKASAGFEHKPGRQQIVLLLGDGESSASATPLTETVRVGLASKLERNEIQFFAIPLGVKLNAHNLHGLAAMTGGAVVRHVDDLGTQKGQADFAQKLIDSFNVPVLRSNSFAFGPNVTEAFPAKLPPMRTDRATLVIGTVKGDTTTVNLTIDGRVNGNRTPVELTQALPAAQDDHYFLHAMSEQWRTAETKDTPAVLPADRALAMAAEQFRLFRDEFLTQAVWAISTDRIDHAEKLYQAASKIDPTDAEAASGLKVVAKMRAGQLTREQIKKGLTTPTAGIANKNGVATRMNVTALANEQTPPPAGGTGGPAQNEIVREAQAKRAIQEQQFKVLVEDTIRKTRQLLLSDPDAAYEDLKRQREAVLANDSIGDATRRSLALQLEAQMRDVQTRGATIKKTIAEQRERVARARAQMAESARIAAAEEHIQARVDAFKQLMQQARFELAQQEAELMRQEFISHGRAVPAGVITGYMIGQFASNLREHKELVRLREDRTLLTLMQVEKSFMPYPDEPPVHFPPAAVWRELTADRKIKYSASSIGPDVPQSLRDLQNTIENSRVRFDQELGSLQLGQITDQLEKQFGVTFVYLEQQLKNAGIDNPREKTPELKQKLNGLPLRSFLDILLPAVNPQLTYIVRPEYIEITTVDRRLEEKVTAAFAVADLVIPIPQAVNQQVLQQGLQFQNAQLAIFGQALGQANFLGGFGALGGGQLGLGGGAIGGLGGLQGGGGGMGPAGFGGAFGQAGQGQNQGLGGGAFGTTGGQLGQFGNLGGQFGFQGGDQSGILLQLIMDTVARGEWSRPSAGQIPMNPNDPNAEDGPTTILPENQLNSIGYYPPARALIVRGTGLYHSQTSIKLKTGAAGGAKGGPGLPGRGDLAQANPPAEGKVEEKNRIVNPKEDPRLLAKNISRDPRRMWQEAMDKMPVNDPGVIVACADFFMQKEAFAPTHAAELLKASLRKGITSDAWTQEALAVAMTLAQDDPADIERAEMSGIDLDPNSPKGFLRAASAAGQHGKFDLALAYCKRAAAAEPNTPAAYTNALTFAANTDGVTTDVVEWAATGLFARDWVNEGVDFHADGKAKLDTIAKKFAATGRQADFDRISAVLAREKQRDLTIEVLYQGRSVDLDLIVTEPSGSTCSAIRKLTSGGGVMTSDILEQDVDRSERYTASQALDGTYTVTVQPVLGRTIGGTATIKVTKFAGTPKQVIETFTVDATKPSTVTVQLTGGSRKELATVPMVTSEERLATTAKPMATGPTGVSGGIGSPTANLMNATTYNKTPALSAVANEAEQKFSAAGGAADVRATAKVSADRQALKISVNPVFAGTATDIPLPKVAMLPGAGE
jgi:hypothetical protein